MSLDELDELLVVSLDDDDELLSGDIVASPATYRLPSKTRWRSLRSDFVISML